MSRWTSEQAAAIHASGASLVVSAAAGSGKTSVLVERLLTLLADSEHPIPAEGMVVVTFTNDAAAEVRQRLEIALSIRLAATPSNEWLRRQQTMLHSAKISTIHTFCFDLIREHFSNFGISAGFRILDETEETILRGEAVADCLEELSAEDAAAKASGTDFPDRQLLMDAFCGNDDQPLEPLLSQLCKWVEQLPFGEYRLLDAADACQDGRILALAIAHLEEQLSDAHRLQIGALAAAQRFGQETLVARITDELVQLEQLQSAIQAKDFPLLAERLRKLSFGSKPRAAKKNMGDPEEREIAVCLRERAIQIQKSLMIWCVPLQFAAKDLPRHTALLRVLYRLVCKFEQTLFAKKQEKNAIGFADAMRLALQLVAVRMSDGSIQKTSLAETLSQQYAFIMIDEFQDADNQQDLIFRMLSHGGDATHYGDNLFVVGDTKQCIYRFRGANPANFLRALAESVPFEATQLTANTKILLNRNFRSANEIVGFVNHVFDALMTTDVGEIVYDTQEQLVQGAVYPAYSRPVELLMLADAALEPQAVAAQIAWHLEHQTPVTTRGGELRPCQPRDFLLLLRNSTKMQSYADAMTAVGIPVCSIESKSYLHSSEISLLLDILRAVDNPLLDVPMAATMLSPMMGFTVDDLVSLRLVERKGSLFQAMRRVTEPSDGESIPEETVSAELKQQCEHFLRFLEALRLHSAMETPEQLIRTIYQQTDFLGMMQLTNRGDQKKANLRALLAHANRFEQNRGGGLSAFLGYVDAILARRSDLEGGGTLAVSENVVMMKTIHKSKGLEAPFVILANTNHLFSHKDREEDVQLHADLGFGFRLHDPETFTFGSTLPYEMIAERNQQEAKSEEMRLLYVALTRAREHLLLPIVYSEKMKTTAAAYAREQISFGGQSDSLTKSGKSMRDWLLMALVRNPACEQLRRVLQVEQPPDESQSALSLWTIAVDEQENEPDTALTTEATEQTDWKTETVDAALEAILEQQCLWRDENPLSGLTAKYGVSELAKAEDFTKPLRRPMFARERRGLTGAERGTALHTFLQYADFAAAATNLATEVQRLATIGRLTPKQAAAVESKTLEPFFASELFARMMASSEVQREKKFTVRIADLHLRGALEAIGQQYAGTEGMLIGIMDLVFAETEGLVLVDYKTDRGVSAEELLERYTEQIHLYAESLQLLSGKRIVACYLFSFSLGIAIPVPMRIPVPVDTTDNFGGQYAKGTDCGR